MDFEILKLELLSSMINDYISSKGVKGGFELKNLVVSLLAILSTHSLSPPLPSSPYEVVLRLLR